jgi:pyrroline-5-carboxylate reductase
VFSGVVVGDLDAENLERLKNEFPEIEISTGDNKRPASCDIVMVALHPPAIKDALGEIKDSLRPESVLVSLAPKVSLKGLADALGGFLRIVRMIPNAPALMGAGFNPLTFGPGFDEEGRGDILEIFSCFGDCPVVREEDLEAYAILAAMGPTYFWFQWEELEKLGATFGLEKEAAAKALSRMIAGAEMTYFHSGLPVEAVMDLIPVRPMKDDEEEIRNRYRARLKALHQKIKP